MVTMQRWVFATIALASSTAMPALAQVRFQAQDVPISNAQINDSGLLVGIHNGILATASYPAYAVQNTNLRVPSHYSLSLNNTGDLVANDVYGAYFYYRHYTGTYFPLSLLAPVASERVAAHALDDQLWKVGTVTVVEGPTNVPRAVLWLPDSNGLTSSASVLPCPDAFVWASHAYTITNDGVIGGSCNGKASQWFWGYHVDLSNQLPREINIRAYASGKVSHDWIDRAQFARNANCAVTKISRHHKYAVNCTYQGQGYAFHSPAEGPYPFVQLKPDNDTLVTILDVNNSGAMVFKQGGRDVFFQGATPLSRGVREEINLTRDYGLESDGAPVRINNSAQVIGRYGTATRVLTPIAP